MNVRNRLSVEELWQWSLKHYARPGVSAACLMAQDQNGADVNLLLLGLWLAVQGYESLIPDQWAALDRAVADWRRDHLWPLRAARRALGPARTPERAAALARELAAEQAEQALLIAALAGLTPPLTAALAGTVADRAARSLARYQQWLGCGFDPATLVALMNGVAGDG